MDLADILVEAIIYHPTFLVFGIVVAIAGITQFFTRKWQGNYAYNAWKSLGLDGVAHSPEFWAKVSIPFNVLFLLIGVGLVVASFLQ